MYPLVSARLRCLAPSLARPENLPYAILGVLAAHSLSSRLLLLWGSDAVHLPFMAPGWGSALPSFACLAGTCWIAFTLVRALLGVKAACEAMVALLSPRNQPK